MHKAPQGINNIRSWDDPIREERERFKGFYTRAGRCGRGVPKEKFQGRWRKRLRPDSHLDRRLRRLELQGYRALFGVEAFPEGAPPAAAAGYA